MTPLDHAIAIAARGWPVFPCRAGESVDPQTGEIKDAKTPLTSIGFRAATTTERIIRRWWSDWPDAMIGVPTGAADDGLGNGRGIGAWVLDIDPRHGGDTSLAALEDEHGPLPKTLTAQTAGGGRHYYFRHVPGVRNRGGLGDGIDVRGTGGYVIAPGSLTADGRAYTWLNEADIADAPEWLLALVVRALSADGAPSSSSCSITTHKTNQPYVDTAIDRELADLAATPMGNRNNALNDASFAIGQFVGAGALPESHARAMLQGVARGWGRDWPRCCKTIENGLRAGIASPREIPEYANSRGPDDAQLIAEGARLAAALLKGAPTDGTAAPPMAISATPFRWREPSTLPRRQWLYGRHYVRKYLSLTVAPGGVGKSSLAVSEALAMITGRPLLGDKPEQQCRVWYFNGEDDTDELARRVMAACLRFNLEPRDIRDRLFIDSGREQSLVVMWEEKRALKIAAPIVDAVKSTIAANKIDCLIIDPFVSTHGVPENDNGAIDKVAKLWAKIADETNTAIEVIHHVKKTDGREVSVDDSRGAGALLAAARSVRVLNRMTDDQAAQAAISVLDRPQYFSVHVGKANLAPMGSPRAWRHLESVALGNGTGLQQPQDHAGVAVEWHWPTDEERAADVPQQALDLIKVRLANGNWRASEQASDWAGHLIADVLAIESERGSAGRKRVKALLRTWIDCGQLKKETRYDPTAKRNAPFITAVA